MNLTNISDDSLREKTAALARRDRETLVALLHHLREVERRRLFAAWKYPSLFVYVQEELKYSEPEAARRISAMRLLKEVPEIEEKIKEGSLSLTNLVLAQALFSKERKAGNRVDRDTKTEVLLRLENQSTREAQRIVAEINPEMKPSGPKLNFDSIDDEQLREKLIKLKDLYAHTDPGMDLNGLLHRLCDSALQTHEKKKAGQRVEAVPSAPVGRGWQGPPAEGCQHAEGSPTNSTNHAEVRRQVWRRDKGKCCNCGSSRALEIDHIIPQAVGGPSTLENMRLLCRSCNQRAAINYFGVKKMSNYLRRANTS